MNHRRSKINFAIFFTIFAINGLTTAEGCDSKIICRFNNYASVVVKTKDYKPVSITDCDYSGCDVLVTDGLFYDSETGTLFYDDDENVSATIKANLDAFGQLTSYTKLIFFGSTCFESTDSYTDYINGLKDEKLPQTICDYVKTNNLQGVVVVDGTREEDSAVIQPFLTSLYDLLKAQQLLLYVSLANPVLPMTDTYVNYYKTYSNICDMILMRGCDPVLSSDNLMNYQSLYPVGQESGGQCHGDDCAIDCVVQKVTNAGVDIKKLAIPVKTDCVLFSLKQGSSNCIGAPVTYNAYGPLWDCSYAWFDEVCMIQNGTPKGKEVVYSCTDRPLAAQIAQYACDKCAGGIYIEAINYDDSGSLCNCDGPYPIKNTIVSVKAGDDLSAIPACLDPSKIPPVEQTCCVTTPDPATQDKQGPPAFPVPNPSTPPDTSKPVTPPAEPTEPAEPNIPPP